MHIMIMIRKADTRNYFIQDYVDDVGKVIKYMELTDEMLALLSSLQNDAAIDGVISGP